MNDDTYDADVRDDDQDQHDQPEGSGHKDTEDLMHDIIGAAIAVHRELGPGHEETVYQTALGIELEARDIEHQARVPFKVTYQDHEVGQGKLDVLVDDQVVLELKAVDRVTQVHKAQLLSYLRASGHRMGLLINFNVPLLKDGIQRVINNRRSSGHGS